MRALKASRSGDKYKQHVLGARAQDATIASATWASGCSCSKMIWRGFDWLRRWKVSLGARFCVSLSAGRFGSCKRFGQRYVWETGTQPRCMANGGMMLEGDLVQPQGNETQGRSRGAGAMPENSSRLLKESSKDGPLDIRFLTAVAQNSGTHFSPPGKQRPNPAKLQPFHLEPRPFGTPSQALQETAQGGMDKGHGPQGPCSGGTWAASSMSTSWRKPMALWSWACCLDLLTFWSWFDSLAIVGSLGAVRLAMGGTPGGVWQVHRGQHVVGVPTFWSEFRCRRWNLTGEGLDGSPLEGTWAGPGHPTPSNKSTKGPACTNLARRTAPA